MHDSLEFGKCHLAVCVSVVFLVSMIIILGNSYIFVKTREIKMQVPTYGIFENISSMEELIAMPQWSADRPLRIVTGYTHVDFLFVLFMLRFLC